MKHYTYKEVIRGVLVFLLASTAFAIINGLLEQWAPSGYSGI